MASVNKVILIGNLGRDPEIRYLPDGTAVASVSIATTDRWKDKSSGEMMEHTEWHRISFFARLAEIAGEYLKKGSQVYIEGSLRTNKWTDQDGVERYTTEVRASEMKMLGGRRDDDGERPERQTPPERQVPQGQQRQGGKYASGRQQPAPASKPASGFDDMDDDIPF